MSSFSTHHLSIILPFTLSGIKLIWLWLCRCLAPYSQCLCDLDQCNNHPCIDIGYGRRSCAWQLYQTKTLERCTLDFFVTFRLSLKLIHQICNDWILWGQSYKDLYILGQILISFKLFNMLHGELII